jgi:uncharacterized membrane protein
MNVALFFALLAGISAAAWTICLKFASSDVNAALGAMIVSGVAFMVNLATMLTMKANGQVIVFKREGLLFLVLAGLAASGVDMFGLYAYNRGLKVTSSLIINATATGVVLIVGFFVLNEAATWPRLAAIGLIAAGMFLLNAQGI